MNKLIASLIQMSMMEGGEITPEVTKALGQAVNMLEMQQDLLRDREQRANAWRRRALEAESKLRLRGIKD